MTLLSLCSCHRPQRPLQPRLVTYDARPRRGDPTGTAGLKARMGAQADKRWQLFARTLRSALIDQDLLGLRGVSKLPHSDKTQGLGVFVQSELQQKVFAQGHWLKPYVQEAGAIAQAHANAREVGGRVDLRRVMTMQALAVSELRGIVEEAQRQLVRVGTHSMLAMHMPHKMWNLFAAVIRAMRGRTRLMVEHVIAKTHATSTLSAYRAAGVTHVGIIPEHVRSVTYVPRLHVAHDAIRYDQPPDEELPGIHVPLPTLVRHARSYWRQQAEALGKRLGAKRALATLEKRLRTEEGRLTQQQAKWAEQMQTRGAEFVARRQAEGEAERARQALMREELRAQMQALVPLPGKPPPRAKSRKGLLQTKEEREQTPSPAVISRIQAAQRRLETAFAGGNVDVLTAGDDRVCFECESISEEGPYSLAKAEELIPAHPQCRCAFVPAGKYEKDSLFDEGPGHVFRGNQYTGGISGGGQEEREGAGGRGGGPGGARSPDEAQRSAEKAAAGHPKLEGLPVKPIKIGDEYYVPGPFGKAQDAAADYMRKAGLPYDPPKQYMKVDPERATRIAGEFDKMQHAPDDPAVKASYEALARETIAQWHAIKDTGLQVEWIKPGQADPYAKTPRLAAMDVTQNNHWWGFPTDAGFGTGEEAEHARHNNPMLQMTDEVVDGRRLMVNDVFRIVHDYFGHFKEGVGFRADGEENAWRSHAAMYSELARGAMTSETRGQNSWVNYGPYGATNRTASAADTHFAPQKIGLMPEWTRNEGRKDRVKDAAPAKLKSLHRPDLIGNQAEAGRAELLMGPIEVAGESESEEAIKTDPGPGPTEELEPVYSPKSPAGPDYSRTVSGPEAPEPVEEEPGEVEEEPVGELQALTALINKLLVGLTKIAERLKPADTDEEPDSARDATGAYAPGHPFHGNQYTGGLSEGGKEDKEDRVPNDDMWGGSFEGSTAITGASAKILGIAGYRNTGDKEAQQVARDMLAVIAKSDGVKEKLYHGFNSHDDFKPGDSLRLPILAASGKRGDALDYANKGAGKPTILEFPIGTKYYGYSLAGGGSGYKWLEALIAGNFRVSNLSKSDGVTTVHLTPAQDR